MLKTRAIARRSVLAGSTGLLFAPAIIGRAAAAATRGVTDTEIIIGTMTDLSGVTAVQGVNNANAMRMAFDEVNARGGIHGRKIRWIVEDKQYIVPKAVQAMNKLLNRDNIFFAVGNGGTPHNEAVMPAMFEIERPQRVPADLRPVDVRTIQPAEVRAVLVLLRPDAGGGEILRQRARQEGRRLDVPGNRLRQATCMPAWWRSLRRWA